MIDLRNCKHGDLLRMRNGEICFYGDKFTNNPVYPHCIMYDNVRYGFRLDDGRASYRSVEHDYDIVEIIPTRSVGTTTVKGETWFTKTTTETTTTFQTAKNQPILKIMKKNQGMYLVNGDTMIPVTADELLSFHKDLGRWLDK